MENMNIEKALAETFEKSATLSPTDYAKWVKEQILEAKLPGYEQHAEIYDKIIERFKK